MPGRGRSGHVRRRRYYNKGRRHPAQRTAGIGRGLMKNKPMELVIHRGLGFPARMRTKCRYSETIGITSTAGALATYVYVANGLFDPNNTGTGHQPMYFDQWMTVYDHYKVLGSKIQVRCIPNSGVAASPTNAFRCALMVDDDTTLSGVTDFNQVIELGMLNNYLVLAGANAPLGQKILQGKWSAKRFFKDKYTSADLSGDNSSNPIETTGFIIVQQPTGNDTITNYYEVVIDYITDFYELKDTPSS